MSDAFIYANPDLREMLRRIRNSDGRHTLELTVGVHHPGLLGRKDWCLVLFTFFMKRMGNHHANSNRSKLPLRLLASLAGSLQLVPILLGLICIGRAELRQRLS